MSAAIDFIYDDGGRAEAAFKGEAGDCVTRAIAIASGMPYREVYDLVNVAGKQETPKFTGKRWKTSTARSGVERKTGRRLLASLGWEWAPTMAIGSGCTVHLRADELPGGRIIAAVTKHLVAVIDGVIHDTHDCSREGTRCVYGYWTRP